jgi:hypothetical protein
MRASLSVGQETKTISQRILFGIAYCEEAFVYANPFRRDQISAYTLWVNGVLPDRPTWSCKYSTVLFRL